MRRRMFNFTDRGTKRQDIVSKQSVKSNSTSANALDRTKFCNPWVKFGLVITAVNKNFGNRIVQMFQSKLSFILTKTRFHISVCWSPWLKSLFSFNADYSHNSNVQTVMKFIYNRSIVILINKSIGNQVSCYLLYIHKTTHVLNNISRKLKFRPVENTLNLCNLFSFITKIFMLIAQ